MGHSSCYCVHIGQVIPYDATSASSDSIRMAGTVIYRGVGPHVRVVSSGRLCREETGRDHSVLQTGVILPFPPYIYTYIQVYFAFRTTYIYIYVTVCCLAGRTHTRTHVGEGLDNRMRATMFFIRYSSIFTSLHLYNSCLRNCIYPRLTLISLHTSTLPIIFLNGHN